MKETPLKQLKKLIKKSPINSYNYDNKKSKWPIIIIVILIILVVITIVSLFVWKFVSFKKDNKVNAKVFKPTSKNTKDNDFVKMQSSSLTLDLIESNQGQCFGIGGAEQITSEETCKEAGGSWDTPCKTNEDCPYFEANKNYLNRRGSCKYGYCELPIGCDTKFRTFRTCGKFDEPQCYNCKEGFEGFGTLGECCEEQSKFPELDTSVNCEFEDIYRCLKSADYAYPGDTNDRDTKQFRPGLTSDRKR